MNISLKSAIKAEFRKLITVRSTYVVTGFVLLIIGLLSFYFQGFKAIGPFNDPHMLADIATGAISGVSILFAIVAVMQVTLEYRHNTIIYSLASARRRTDVFLAKAAVITAYVLIATLAVCVMAPLLAFIALNLRHASVVHQQIPLLDILWRVLFFSWAHAMLALIIAIIVRSQIVSIVALFLLPSTVEQLLGVLLKKNQVYLPFNALGNILQTGSVSHARAMLVVTAYILVGGLIALKLVMRRDAN